MRRRLFQRWRKIAFSPVHRLMLLFRFGRIQPGPGFSLMSVADNTDEG
jgi:hypothetical protein